MKKQISLLVAFLSVITVCAYPSPPPQYFDSIAKTEFQGYAGQGKFVEYPAYVGSCFGYILGIVPAVICSEPERIVNLDQASNKLGAEIIESSAKTFGCLFGGIPYGFKKVFWDLPAMALNSPNNEKSHYDYKPQPPQIIKVDSRLLTNKEKVGFNLKTNIPPESALIKIKKEAPLPKLSSML